jgi:peptidoglycan/xylan/chitin deacetylase (PgdA/CDA1 family)
MHRIVGVLLCLAGGIAVAGAQTVSPPAAPAAQQAAALVVKTIAPAGERQAVKPATPAVTTAAIKPAEQATAKTSPTAAPKPTEQATAKPDATAATEPAIKPAEQAAAKPATPATAEPAAKPATPATTTAAIKPAEQAVAKPEATPAPKSVAEAACPGHPGALGTERVLTISPEEFQLLGVINYKQTLPLRDHEVVLTFDDGPIPPFTNSVLDTLAANCVKATYFLVGEMAHLRPYLVRRIYNEGHSIGTHSQDHPFAFQRLSMAKVAYEVNAGIASVDAAIGNPQAVSPFFRIPGFGRTKAIDAFLENKGLITWSADIDTDDWKRGTTPSELITRTMRRLNARGRGIILMHDIHPDTALALPMLLKELKKEGYRVVHVVAAGARPQSVPEIAPTALEQESWPRVLHARSEKHGPAAAALRRRVHMALAEKHRHRVAAHKQTATIDYRAIALERTFNGN